MSQISETPPSAVRDDAVALKAQAARGGVWLAISALLTKGTQIGLLLALAVLLNPRDLGLLAIGTLVFNIILVIQDLGITDVINRSWERGRKVAEEVERTALTLTIVGALLLVVVFWLAAPLIAEGIGTPRATWVVRWMVLPIPFVAVSWVQMARMQRDMAFQRRLVPDAVPAVCGAVATIGLLLVTDAGIWAMVIGNAVTCVLSPFCAWLVGYSVTPGWHREHAGEILTWARHSTPASFLVLLTLNIDYILVARWLGEQQLGYYSLAFRISYVPFVLVVTVLNAAAFPYYVRMPGMAELREAVAQVLNTLSVFVFALCGALFLFAPSVQLLGKEWTPAEGPLRGLAIYAALNAVAHTLQLPLKAIGHVKLFFYAQLLHLVALAAFLVILTPHGVTAVGVAQCLAVTVVLIASQIMLRSTAHFSLLETIRALRVPVIATAAMALVAWALELSSLRASTWSGAIILPVISLGTYAGVVWLFSRRNTVESLKVIRGGSA
jgi:O-antigen/teichoic acid export membrane protein